MQYAPSPNPLVSGFGLAESGFGLGTALGGPTGGAIGAGLGFLGGFL
jgi:hypothetical protein